MGGPFWVLHFKVEDFGSVQNQVLSTFGKSESFTKSATYAMCEKSDKKEIKTSHCNSRALFTRKMPNKNTSVATGLQSCDKRMEPLFGN